MKVEYIPVRNASFVRHHFNSLPWRVSALGHTTNVWLARTWGEVRTECFRSPTLGSLYNLFVPPDWKEGVYDVGGFIGYFTGHRNFVLSARCVGVSFSRHTACRPPAVP